MVLSYKWMSMLMDLPHSCTIKYIDIHKQSYINLLLNIVCTQFEDRYCHPIWYAYFFMYVINKV